MLTLSRYASPEVARMLAEVQSGEKQFDVELRRGGRQLAALPVEVRDVEGESEVSRGFSKNLSRDGVCLITQHAFDPKSRRSLKITGARQDLGWRSATCRWRAEYGDEYFISGWQLDDPLDVASVIHEDQEFGFERRDDERKKLAIPVLVHQKSSTTPIRCYSRNLGPCGVCLVSAEMPHDNAYCMLEMISSGGRRNQAIANCVWSTQLDVSLWISGWEFPRLERVQQYEMRFFRRREV